MASDLSTLIQDGLCNTLNGLLAKTTTITSVNKVHEKDISELQTLKVNSTFEFQDIVSTWSFIIPAYTASHIFNQMMGDDSEPVEQIDGDIADAINEVVSNISGGLTTTINSSGLADLGDVKFTTTSEGIVDGKDLIEEENLFKFSLDLEGVDILIFVQFDNIILPFINNIKASEISHYEEEIEPEPEPEPEVVPEPEPEISAENTVDNESSEKIENRSDEVEEKEEITEEIDEDEAKNKKLKLIIIIIASLIVLTLGAGATMYFMGTFDPEPIKVVDKNSTAKTKSKDGIDVVKYHPKNNIHFNVSKINKRRLNARLEILTKYDILNAQEIEKQKLEEKERLYNLEKEKLLMEFASKNKEEPLFSKKEDAKVTKIIPKTKFTQDNLGGEDSEYQVSQSTIKKPIAKSNIQNSKMKFLVLDSLKYKLFKNTIAKAHTQNARISICQNKQGRTTIYLGPFSNTSDIETITKLIEQSDTILTISPIDISQEEFDKRCNF